MQMALKELSIGGVPEHFNLPFYLATEQDPPPAELPFRVAWSDVPAGTGAMCQALEDGTLDVAVLLTEGIVAHIAQGGTARLVGSYTRSPLVWGVHCAAKSGFHAVSDLEGARFAISRYGSGSHLMAVVQARALGWSEPPSFVVAGGLDGGREALAQDRADAFMWERTMSKPYVDAGEWRRVGDFSAPWPAFLIAVSEAFAATSLDALPDLLSVVRGHCEALTAQPDRAATLISDRFHLDAADARAWMDHIDWSCTPTVERAMLERVVTGLRAADILDPEATIDLADLCADPTILR